MSVCALWQQFQCSSYSSPNPYLPLAAITMNIPDTSMNLSFEEFEHLMQQPRVFRNQTRATIGKGKGKGKAECQEKAECPSKGSLGKGKGKARDKNQIVRTYYAPAEDTRQARGCAMTNINKTKSKFKWHGMAVLIIF